MESNKIIYTPSSDTVFGVPKDRVPKNIPEHSVSNILRIEAIYANPEKYIDQIGTVAGWARTVRLQANNTIAFIELSDGSTHETFQVVVDNVLENFEQIKKCDVSTSFKIKGKFVKSPGTKQPIEMQVNTQGDHTVEIVGSCDAGTYPLAKKFHNPETLRQLAHLRPRTNLIGAVARIRNSLSFATHLFFQSRGHLYIHTPIITASDCEGAGEMFQVTTVLPDTKETVAKIKTDKTQKIDYGQDFFKKPAFLTVSGQLAVENYACALSNVYTFGPTFRAENSNTKRHLAEFWMIEPEICFGDLFDDMELAESYLKFSIKYVLENNSKDLEFLDQRVKKGLLADLKHVYESDFERITYTDAVERLEKAVAEAGVKFEIKPEWGKDLGTEHERYLTDEVFKKPVIVYNYPKGFKAFYMRLNEDQKTVAAMDILVPGVGEIIGGSQREERLDVLESRIIEAGLSPEGYSWYLDLRRYGTVPHAGFGLGFERLVMYCTGVDNIRDSIPYPRFPGNADF